MTDFYYFMAAQHTAHRQRCQWGVATNGAGRPPTTD
jgi:hypothetical protein